MAREFNQSEMEGPKGWTIWKVVGRIDTQTADDAYEKGEAIVSAHDKTVLDIRTGEFSYVNGGHNAPLIGRCQGDTADWQYLRDEKKACMVGVIEEAAYMEKKLTLQPGDMLYFYTDGVTEAMDEEGKLYTEERLQQTLQKETAPTAAVREILAAVRTDIGIHANGAEQSDDITMLGIRYLG